MDQLDVFLNPTQGYIFARVDQLVGGDSALVVQSSSNSYVFF